MKVASQNFLYTPFNPFLSNAFIINPFQYQQNIKRLFMKNNIKDGHDGYLINHKIH